MNSELLRLMPKMQTLRVKISSIHRTNRKTVASKIRRRAGVIVMKRQDAETVDRYGRSGLHHAATKGDLTQLRELLDAGLDPDLRDSAGMTPLHFAAQEWHPEIASALLEGGAQVDVQSSHGNTPLFDAVYNSRGRGEVIEVLRAHGANPMQENNHGQTPLSLARLIGNFDVVQYFDDMGE